MYKRQVLRCAGEAPLGHDDVLGDGPERHVRHEPPHRVARPPAVHPVAHLRDAAGEAGSRAAGEGRAADPAQSARAQERLRRAHARGVHLDEHLSRSGPGRGHLHDP